MADVSDQGIIQGQPFSYSQATVTRIVVSDPPAYLDVRSDKSDTNWLLLDYEVRFPSLQWLGLTRLPHTRQSDRSDKLAVTKTGTHGLPELRDALDDSKASYGYARVTYSNDKESRREKFILVVWIGSGCKVMRKAKVGLRSSVYVQQRVYLSEHRRRVVSFFFSAVLHTLTLP